MKTDEAIRPAFMNAQRLASELTVSVGTVRRWAKEGRIPPGKSPAGGIRLWQWSEVERKLGIKSGGSPEIDWIKRIRDATL